MSTKTRAVKTSFRHRRPLLGPFGRGVGPVERGPPSRGSGPTQKPNLLHPPPPRPRFPRKRLLTRSAGSESNCAVSGACSGTPPDFSKGREPGRKSPNEKLREPKDKASAPATVTEPWTPSSDRNETAARAPGSRKISIFPMERSQSSLKGSQS